MVRRQNVFIGSRIARLTLGADVAPLRPPAPVDPLRDVAAATAEALRYPLSGATLEQLATRRGRATIVVDRALLPVPGTAEGDPRQDALAAVIDELHAQGMPHERQTLLVAGGIEQRAGRRELEALLRPDRARAFRGDVVTHDCEADDLRAVGEVESVAVRMHPALLDADLVVTVTAAETVLHGGPAAITGACGPGVGRALVADSLLETRSARGWRLGVGVEALLARHTPVLGVSLVLGLPRPTSTRGPLRFLHNLAPDALRRSRLDGAMPPLGASPVLAGPPSVAHAEGLIRGVALRAVALPHQLDAIVVPLPWSDAHSPRGPLNPITVAATGLGIGLRLWREASPLAPGGTIVLVHPLTRTMGHGSRAPYRALFAALRNGPAGARLRETEAVAARDPRALGAYREGRAPHPRLPFADWEGCAPPIAHAGRVIVAGCRDAGAARSLGFVPSRSLTAALEMARGLAGPDGRIGFLSAPPYPPLLVG